MVEFVIPGSEEDFDNAAKLFLEYSEWLGIDLGFQGFTQELQQLPIMYGGTKGIIILCKNEGVVVACVGVRRFADEIGEIKRMYVKPAYRRKGIAAELLKRALEFAVKAGYHKVVLDTLDTMTPAMNLYLKNGFEKVPAYYHNPEPGAVYFKKQL